MPSGELPETPARARRLRAKRQQRRIFVLDTNVLMHDPTAIFRFEEHDIFIPMMVLEELDAGKKGLSEAARNVRQVSRFLDELMASATKEQIDRGPGAARREVHATAAARSRSSGRLFFQTRQLVGGLPDTLPGHGADNAILGADARAAEASIPKRASTLVSKDINLRIKAAILGVHAEDYYSDKTIEDADLLYTGVAGAARELLGAPRQGLRLLAGAVAHVLSRARPDGRASWHVEPVPVPGPARTASRRMVRTHRRRRRSARAACATTAASATASGASPRATASRTSRSTC